MAISHVAAALMRPSWCTTAEVLEQVELLGDRAVAAEAELLALAGGLAWWPIGYTAGLSRGASNPWQALAKVTVDLPDLRQRCLEVGSRLLTGLMDVAAAHRLWLVAGGIPLPAEEGLGNACVLLAPDGRLAGMQWQTHLDEHQAALGLTPGDSLAPMDADGCPMGLLAGDDHLFPEVARILCLQGASMLVHPGTASAGERAAMMARLWRDVQGNQVFGLEAGYSGPGPFGAAVLGPCELTSDGSGILAQVGGEEPAIAVADLDWGRLRQVVEAYPIHASLNPALYQRYLLDAYLEALR